MMEGVGKNIADGLRALVISAVIGGATLGAGIYATASRIDHRQDTKEQMAIVADNHPLYGNRNGQFDYDERVAAMKSIGKQYDLDKTIRYHDAKAYLEQAQGR